MSIILYHKKKTQDTFLQNVCPQMCSNRIFANVSEILEYKTVFLIVLYMHCDHMIFLDTHLFCSFFAVWHSFNIQKYRLNNKIFAENTQSLKINLHVIEVQRWWFVPFHKIEEFSVNTGKRDVIELELPNGKFYKVKSTQT